MNVQDKIITLLHERSEQAIESMTKEYGRLCWKIAGGVLSSFEDVEEVVSDTMLAAWNRIPPEKPQSLAAYLCKITRNLSLARLRQNSAAKRNERLKVCLSELEESIPTPDTPDAKVEYALLAQCINTYLSGQTQTNRYLFVRRYFYMDSCKEIAGAIGLSEQAVRSRLMRMRTELRNYLQKEEIIE